MPSTYLHIEAEAESCVLRGKPVIYLGKASLNFLLLLLEYNVFGALPIGHRDDGDVVCSLHLSKLGLKFDLRRIRP